MISKTWKGPGTIGTHISAGTQTTHYNTNDNPLEHQAIIKTDTHNSLTPARYDSQPGVGKICTRVWGSLLRRTTKAG